MPQVDNEKVKSNVAQFDNDVSRLGGYAYAGGAFHASLLIPVSVRQSIRHIILKTGAY